MQSPSNLTSFARCVPVCDHEVHVVRLPLDGDLGVGGLDVISHVLYHQLLLWCQQGLQTLVFYDCESVDVRLKCLFRELVLCLEMSLDVLVICGHHRVHYDEYHKSGLCINVQLSTYKYDNIPSVRNL
jgi:hypothetical protein